MGTSLPKSFEQFFLYFLGEVSLIDSQEHDGS